MDAIEPRMVSTLFPRGVGAESGGTRDDGPAATLDEIASIETKGGCSSEVIQRKSEGFLATEPGASKNKQKTIKMIACVDQTAGLEAGKSASEDGGSGRSVVSHGTTALLPLASGLFKGFQGGGLEQKGKKIVGVVLLSGGQFESGRVSSHGANQPLGGSSFPDVHHWPHALHDD